MEFFVSFLKLSGFSQFAIPGLQLFMSGDAECSFIVFFFTLKRTLGYYYGNDQNTTKTIKSRQWLCSNCHLYTFHSVLYVFSERKTGYLMPPYAIAIHSSGSVLQEWWSEQAMNGSTVLVGKQRDTAPSRGLVDFVRLDRLYCCVSESLHLGSFFFSFFFLVPFFQTHLIH